MALFTNKLGVAILVAAIIRVREGLSSAPSGFPSAGYYPRTLHFFDGVSNVGLYVAPLGLLAADLVWRLSSRRQVSAAILAGVSLPMFFTLSLSGIIGVATLASHFYRPSLNPTLAMALFSNAADSAIRPRLLIVGITTFGAVRFGVGQALAASVQPIRKAMLVWLALVALIGVTSMLALYPLVTGVVVLSEICAKCLSVCGAVLTADLVSGSNKAQGETSKFDVIGVLAVLTGVAVAVGLPHDYLWARGQWWLPWLLPSYLAAFLMCFLGRRAQLCFCS